MAFTKGKSGNPDGRPQGSKNKTTADIRGFLLQFLKDNYAKFEKDFYSLTPEQRSTLWLKGAMHLIPKALAEQEDKDRIEGIEMRIVYPDGTVEVKKPD